MCKQLLYKIVNNEKLDWLKKENPYTFDKINWYFIFLGLVSFITASKFKDLGLFMLMSLAFIGSLSSIKSTPNDIESSIMKPMMCISLIFFFVGMLSSFFKLCI